jgi:predicted PurR-regulated permease PerM
MGVAGTSLYLLKRPRLSNGITHTRQFGTKDILNKEIVMDKENKKHLAIQSLVILTCIVIIVAGMRAADSLLVPFLLALFLAIICSLPMFWLRQKGLSSGLSLIIVTVVIVAIGLGVSVVVGKSLADFFKNLSAYQTILQEKYTAMLFWLSAKGVQTSDLQNLDVFNAKFVMDMISKLLGNLSKVLTNTLVILLTIIFILMEASGFPSKLRAALTTPEKSISRFSEITNSVKKYLGIKTCCSLLTGFMIFVILEIFGVDLSVLWGFIAFLFNFIPTIGSIVAAIPGITMTLIQFDMIIAVYVTILYLVINIGISNVIEPKLMGRGLGLSTLVVFISLVFWGWVLGTVGMLLSVILTMILKIVLESSEETRWIAILLGPGKEVKEI